MQIRRACYQQLLRNRLITAITCWKSIDAFYIEQSTGFGCFCELVAGSVLVMGQVLWMHWFWVTKMVQGSFNVSGHGHMDSAILVIPFEH
jgi:hypothetical protein